MQRPGAGALQAKRFGYNNDAVEFFGFDGASDNGMLCINHEFGGNDHVLGKPAPETLEDVRLSQHAHGVSVVEIKKVWGKWRQVNSSNARRIHVNTPVAFSGPANGLFGRFNDRDRAYLELRRDF